MLLLAYATALTKLLILQEQHQHERPRSLYLSKVEARGERWRMHELRKGTSIIMNLDSD